MAFSIFPSSNVLSLRARSLHSLPDSWQPGAFPYTFSLAMPLAQPPNNNTSAAVTPTSSRGIVIPQGALKLSPDKDHSAVSSHWRWPHLPGVTTNASLVGSCPMEPCPLEEEVGQLNTKQVNNYVAGVAESNMFVCSLIPRPHCLRVTLKNWGYSLYTITNLCYTSHIIFCIRMPSFASPPSATSLVLAGTFNIVAGFPLSPLKPSSTSSPSVPFGQLRSEGSQFLPLAGKGRLRRRSLFSLIMLWLMSI